MDAMRRLVRLLPDGGYELDLDCFRHHAEGVEMVWDGGEPTVGRIFSDAMVDLLGPPRAPDEPIDARHKDLAASLQAMYEEAFFHLLDRVQQQSGSTALCLAGGCGMNSVANGKIFERTRLHAISGSRRRPAMPAARSVRPSRSGTRFSASPEAM